MGTEISQSQFSRADFSAFHERLSNETALLEQWLIKDAIQRRQAQGGFELEAWVIDIHGIPANQNDRIINLSKNDMAVPELAQFNIELNGHPHRLQGHALSKIHEDIRSGWKSVTTAASQIDLRMLMIGILPTARREDFRIEAMSPLQRYLALNEQIFKQRQDRPAELNIKGHDHLLHHHHDVMLESATTSFQIHLRTHPDEAVRLYNASKIISAPMVAISANSPYLFGHDLWAESRIPVFEQSIEIGQSEHTKRVSFGYRYAKESIFEIFDANLKHYPVLLPELMDEKEESLAHLRLHNGTIWRWNRPLVGFDADGSPHLRIEHRVGPSGPTPADMTANAALYYGCVRAMVDANTAYETLIPFKTAKENFYSCAKDGLNANIHWCNGNIGSVKALLSEKLLPMAREGLNTLGIERDDIDKWLGIIQERLKTGQNGSYWQRSWIELHGEDFHGLVSAYHENQESGRPVHLWSLT